MEITPELREHAKSCRVCCAQLMLIEAAKQRVATEGGVAESGHAAKPLIKRVYRPRYGAKR